MGISLLISGILIIITFYQASAGRGLQVLISNTAIERSKKDLRVRNYLKRYIHEIEMIKQDPINRPQEKIGDFEVSPRSRAGGGIRIAWHLDRTNNALYIDDLLYHVKERKYIDNWAEKAQQRKITKKDYENKGYREFTGAI